MDGVNAYRVAEFEVSYELLKQTLHMPPETLVMGVREGNSLHRTFVIKVADPALPPCPINQPPMISPIVTKESIRWDWNVKT